MPAQVICCGDGTAGRGRPLLGGLGFRRALPCSPRVRGETFGAPRTMVSQQSPRLSLAVECKKAARTKTKTAPKKKYSRGGGLPDAPAGMLANNITPLTRSSDGKLRVSTLNRCRTLVLDCSCRPIDVVNWQRAICYDLFDKGDVLEYYDELVHASSSSYPVPAVVKTRYYMKPSSKEPPCIRRFVLIRDNFECQYCGSNRDLTMDHVIPASKGGSWSWTNLVACCSSCNSKKANKLLKDLGWKLKKQPKAPPRHEFDIIANVTKCDLRSPPKEWRGYLNARQLNMLLEDH